MFSLSNVTRTLCMAKRKTTPLDDAATDSIFDVLGTTPDEVASTSESSSVPSETAKRSLEPLPLRSVLSAAVPPANSNSPARNTKADTAPETPKAPKPTKSIKPPKTPQLEKSIKEEALALFQKGLTIEEVARELMLPPSAVRDWEALYQDGKLTKFGKARIAADEREKQEPTLFFKAK